jgi:hypothetical protein
MIMKQLTGQLVNVTLRDMMPTKIKGTLKECDEITICIDRGDGKPNLHVPLTSILHVESVQEK